MVLLIQFTVEDVVAGFIDVVETVASVKTIGTVADVIVGVGVVDGSDVLKSINLKIKYLFKKPDLNSTYPGSYDDIDPAKTTSVSSGKSTSKSLIFNG